MDKSISLQLLLAETGTASQSRLSLLALLTLGILESLTSGVVGAADAVRIFFNAENCLFVRQNLREKIADEIMSRGVQLPDLFDALPPEEAQREFQSELTKLRDLCLRLLAEKQVAA